MRELLKRFKFIRDIYYKHKERKFENLKKKRSTTPHTFINRSKSNEKLLVILAGYKDRLFDLVFERVKAFLPKDIDVCIVSSGKYHEGLAKRAEVEGYSYLSTKRNHIGLALNVAINQFEKVKYIYKIDEDIFLTKGFFETLFDTYQKVLNEGDFTPGIVAPLIPINGYTHLEILKKLKLVDTYTKKFELPKYASMPYRMIENNDQVARFFWGEGGFVPKLDKLNEIFKKDQFKVSGAPHKFSIGAILFTKDLWNDMGRFSVQRGNGLGIDEIDLNKYCYLESLPVVVSHNQVVGHFSFGKQTKSMFEYLDKHPEMFKL